MGLLDILCKACLINYFGVKVSKSSKTKYAVLGMLSIKPMSGYEMKSFMTRSTEHFWSESNGQLYPALARLAKEQLVTFKTEQVGAKEKKIYEITDAGKAVLNEWLMSDVNVSPERNELLLKIFFGHNVPIDVTIEHVKERERISRKALKLYKDIQANVLDRKDQIPPHRYKFIRSTILYGMKFAQLEVEWCAETLALLQE